MGDQLTLNVASVGKHIFYVAESNLKMDIWQRFDGSRNDVDALMALIEVYGKACYKVGQTLYDVVEAMPLLSGLYGFEVSVRLLNGNEQLDSDRRASTAVNHVVSNGSDVPFKPGERTWKRKQIPGLGASLGDGQRKLPKRKIRLRVEASRNPVGRR